MRADLVKLVALARRSADQSYGVQVGDFSDDLREFIRAEPFRVEWVENVVPVTDSVRLLGAFSLLTADEIEGIYDPGTYEFSRFLKPLGLWGFGCSDGSIWAHDAGTDRVVYMAPFFDEESFESNILKQWSSVAEFVDEIDNEVRQWDEE